MSRSANHRYEGNLPPIPRFAAVRGAAVGVEAGFVGVCVEAEPFDRADARRFEPRGDVAFEVEPGVAFAALLEEPRVEGVGDDEPRLEIGVDLVARLGDARADRGGDPLAPGAERLH